MKKVYVILSLVLSVCFLVGSAQAKPDNFNQNSAAKIVLGDIWKLWGIMIDQAIKAQKTQISSKDRETFFDYLGTQVVVMPGVTDNRAFRQRVALYYNGRKNFKRLQKWLNKRQEQREIQMAEAKLEAEEEQQMTETEKERAWQMPVLSKREEQMAAWDMEIEEQEWEAARENMSNAARAANFF